MNKHCGEVANGYSILQQWQSKAQYLLQFLVIFS